MAVNGDTHASQAELIEWQSLCQMTYAPRRMVFAISNEVSNLPAAIDLHKPQSGPVAYICRGQVCEMPVEDIAKLELALTRTGTQA